MFFFISKYVHGEIKTYISYVRLGSTFSNDPIKSNKVHRLNRHRQLSACLGFMLSAFMFDVLCQRLSESVSQMEFYLLCLRNIKYLDINPRLFWCYKNYLSKCASLSSLFCFLFVLVLPHCLHLYINQHINKSGSYIFDDPLFVSFFNKCTLLGCGFWKNIIFQAFYLLINHPTH